jgi:predicted DNA-binding transcriptional regulator AlpA
VQLNELPAQLARDPDYLDRLINESDAATFLGFSIRALQGWRFKGGGPRFVKIGGRAVRYRRRDLIGWSEANLRASTADTVARAR